MNKRQYTRLIFQRKTLAKESLGFTLVEIIIAVTVIAVISSIGITSYSTIGNSAQDTKKKADIETIAKAYELSFDPTTLLYRALVASDFINGSIPTPPDNTSYTGLIATGQTAANYTVCATLDNNTQYCKSSSQDYIASATNAPFTGTPAPSTPTPTPTLVPPTATPTPIPIPTATPTPSLASGLASYWDMDEPSGTLLNDSAGNNDGTNGNGVVSVVGKLGRARYMNGYNRFISIGTATNLRNPPFTISAWVAFADLGPSAVIFSHAAGGNDGGYVFLKGTSGEGSLFSLARSPGGSCTSTSGIGSNAFRHLVVTYDGSQCRFYIQGSLVSTISFSTTFTGTGGFIGSQNTNGGFLNGTIDEVGVWNRVLSLSEVQQLYNGGDGRRP